MSQFKKSKDRSLRQRHPDHKMAPTPPKTPNVQTIQNTAIKKKLCIFSEVNQKPSKTPEVIQPSVDVNKSISFKVENVQRPITSKPIANIIKLKEDARDTKS